MHVLIEIEKFLLCVMHERNHPNHSTRTKEGWGLGYSIKTNGGVIVITHCSSETAESRQVLGIMAHQSRTQMNFGSLHLEKKDNNKKPPIDNCIRSRVGRLPLRLPFPLTVKKEYN